MGGGSDGVQGGERAMKGAGVAGEEERDNRKIGEGKGRAKAEVGTELGREGSARPGMRVWPEQ